MICRHCGNEIHPKRIAFFEKYKNTLPSTCTECSSSTRVGAIPIISGKNTYSELQIVDDERQAADILFMQNRKGSIVSSGVRGMRKRHH